MHVKIVIADMQNVFVLQYRALNPESIDPHAIQTAQIEHLPLAVGKYKSAMASANFRRAKADVGNALTTDYQFRTGQVD